MKNTFTWSTTPPTPEAVKSHEFWYRRIWVQEVGSTAVIPLLDMYMVMYHFDTNKKAVAMLSGSNETIAVSDIMEDAGVEWQPVRDPEGETAATESIELQIE